MEASTFVADESTWQGVRRLALAELARADAVLADSSLDPFAVVHDTRKSIKRLRALLRLIEKALRGSFRRLDRQLARVARSLAHFREHSAALEALAALEASAPPSEQERFARARAHWPVATPARLLVVRGLLIHGRSELAQLSRKIETWPAASSGFELLERGVRLSYRRARRALRALRKSPTVERHHQLRKAVKAHLYQMGYLAEVWPPALGPRRDRLTQLASLLGDHHDLALLTADLEQRDFADLAESARTRVETLELEVRTLADDLFQVRAREFTATLTLWFEHFTRADALTAARAEESSR